MTTTHGHYVLRCRCGVMLEQCRCIGPKQTKVAPGPCTHEPAPAPVELYDQDHEQEVWGMPIITSPFVHPDIPMVATRKPWAIWGDDEPAGVPDWKHDSKPAVVDSGAVLDFDIMPVIEGAPFWQLWLDAFTRAAETPAPAVFPWWI